MPQLTQLFTSIIIFRFNTILSTGRSVWSEIQRACGQTLFRLFCMRSPFCWVSECMKMWCSHSGRCHLVVRSTLGYRVLPPTVWPWARYLRSLHFCFIIYKMGDNNSSYFLELQWGWNEWPQVKTLNHCLAHSKPCIGLPLPVLPTTKCWQVPRTQSLVLSSSLSTGTSLTISFILWL